MKRKTFNDLVADLEPHIREIFPWDLEEEIDSPEDILLLDVRCPMEYQAMHIENSINVPRGVLETACDYGYEHTVPELVEARGRRVIVICRSGKRSVLATHTMQLLGYKNIVSLKTGLRGWSDSEYPLLNIKGNGIDQDKADNYFLDKIGPDQMGPRN